MKKLFLIFLSFFLLLSGCGPKNYNEVLKRGYSFTSLAESKKLIGKNKGAWGSSYVSQSEANNLAMGFCQSKYSDCVIVKEGHKTVYKNTEEAIMFTIKDKREQCEAIGFKPETEKFADCVLRLVELDVKQLTQNQIAVAQNNGNDALVKQLKRQSDLQSSQALIDLGQQLMNPKQYNSNIYMPQTTRCTMQGFGTFATMRCR